MSVPLAVVVIAASAVWAVRSLRYMLVRQLMLLEQARGCVLRIKARRARQCENPIPSTRLRYLQLVSRAYVLVGSVDNSSRFAQRGLQICLRASVSPKTLRVIKKCYRYPTVWFGVENRWYVFSPGLLCLSVILSAMDILRSLDGLDT